MATKLSVFILVALLIASGCSTPGPEMNQTEPGRDVVNRMIEAHGGLEKWRSAPTVSYQMTVEPTGRPKRLSRETVEQGRRRAYQDYPELGYRMSWDGEKAWTENWKDTRSARFAALTNYYFINLPWLAADPGVILSEPGTGRLPDDATEYITVKMTFETGVGDTPEDYYILHIDPASYLLKAAEYTVTFGRTEPSEPRIFVYDEFTTVDGLIVPTKCTTYIKADYALHRLREISGWSFREPFDESRMVMPSHAVVDTTIPWPGGEIQQ